MRPFLPRPGSRGKFDDLGSVIMTEDGDDEDDDQDGLVSQTASLKNDCSRSGEQVFSFFFGGFWRKMGTFPEQVLNLDTHNVLSSATELEENNPTWTLSLRKNCIRSPL